MKISNEETLQALKQAFNAQFPNLKLEFYKSAHQSGEGSEAREQLDGQVSVGAVRAGGESGTLEVDPNMTVADFEQMMADRFHLYVQLFRRSGNIWLQTTSTDAWILSEQNRKGGSSAEHYNEKYNG